MRTFEQTNNLNTMENLFIYLLVGLAVIFLVLSFETLAKDFKCIVKDIKRSINQ